jgi:hypothetical protein
VVVRGHAMELDQVASACSTALLDWSSTGWNQLIAPSSGQRAAGNGANHAAGLASLQWRRKKQHTQTLRDRQVEE